MIENRLNHKNTYRTQKNTKQTEFCDFCVFCGKIIASGRTCVGVAVVTGIMLLASVAHAAVGCTLSNPAQDLKYLFPEMTTYKEDVKGLDQMKDGRDLFGKLKERLGSDLDPVYETYETPYTVYTIFKGEQVLGYVHGVNVPGEGGVIQIFLSADPKTGAIIRLFFQRIESTVAKLLKKKDFLAQFAGLTLGDFYKHDYFSVTEPASVNDRVGKITSPIPAGQADNDYRATLRGVLKNLILLDLFVYNEQNEPFYKKAREALAEKGKQVAGKKEEKK